MSQHSQYSQTNGASLEDCHTNFFSLTDLCGINWRVYRSEYSQGIDQPLHDPVLQSYARCISADVLCVWRRVWDACQPPLLTDGFHLNHLHPGVLPGPLPRQQQQQHHSLRSSAKELWVFWYGEEPDFSRLVSTELAKGDSTLGSWNCDTGLSYECRTLLFKALHNLIERCLLNRNFIRLGKWFVQPLDGPECVPPNSLSFFVHGESNVCASVDVRQHPVVRRLCRKHLVLAQQTNPGIPVILGPYGLRGTLTGVVHRIIEPATQKLLDDWKHFFRIGPRPTTDSGNIIPPVVEVIVGGMKMRYPSCCVLVTDMDDFLLGSQSCTGGVGISPQKINEKNKKSQDTVKVSSSSVQSSPFMTSMHTLMPRGYLSCSGRGLGYARKLGDQVWQDVQCSTSSQHMEDSTASSDIEHWPCSCSKSQKGRHGVNIRGNINIGRGAKTGCSGGMQNGAQTPLFHHRVPQDISIDPCDPSSYEDILFNRRLGHVCSTGCAGITHFSGYKCSVPTPASVPNLHLSGAMDGHPGSLESPSSVTPPPLPTPHSQTSSVSHHELRKGRKLKKEENPVMPTLSPHPPSNASVGGNPTTPAAVEPTELKSNINDSTGPKSTSSVYQGMSPYPSAGERIVNSDTADGALCSVINNCESPGSVTSQATKGLKRPYLPKCEYEEVMEDYVKIPFTINSKVDNWVTHPVKKLKLVEPKKDDPHWPPYRPQHIVERLELVTHTVKLENELLRNSRLDSFNCTDAKLGEVKFEDKENIKSFDALSPSHVKTSSVNLFTTKGLQPSISDLDTMFESDSPEDEPQFPDNTPPGSNKPVGALEDTATIINCKSSNTYINHTTVCNTTKMPGAPQASFVDMTTMFPTPPSLEQDPGIEETSYAVSSGSKQEIFSPEDLKCHEVYGIKEEYRESVLVYKPPQLAPFVGSDRYKPLVDLPSRKEPIITLSLGCIYKPSWEAFSTVEKPSVVPPVMPGPIHTTPLKVGLSPVSPAVSALNCPIEVGNSSHLSQRGGPSSAGPSLAYELPSPASNQSSYLNRTLPSVEGPPSCAPPTQVPEASSLYVNIVLQDSCLNLFRDHNFDSCTICVCNSGQKIVGNIRGSDGGLYLPPSYLSSEEEGIMCSCGYSAVVNRKLAFNSGLFYEDEVDLTGIRESLFDDHHKPPLSQLIDPKGELANSHPDRDITELDQIPTSVYELLMSQCIATLSTPSSLVYRAACLNHSRKRSIPLNLVYYRDCNEIAAQALEQAKYSSPQFLYDGMDGSPTKSVSAECMHKWCFYQFEGPSCSQDLMRCVRALEPHLQEAMQKTRSSHLRDAGFKVDGPLTWRTFHRKALRGTEDMAEPLPIPMLLVSYEKDWLSVAPQCLRHWEKLLLEPYSQTRNVEYFVIAPPNDFILYHVKSFFKELSAIYELCRLGKHTPIADILHQGIYRMTKELSDKVAGESFDEWFSLLGDSVISAKLKDYSQNSSFVPGANFFKNEEDDTMPPPAVMIYLVDPLSVGQDHPNMYRLITLGLLRCYKRVLDAIPYNMQNNIYFQVISLESILELAADTHDRSHQVDHLKSLAFSVFMQCKRIINKHSGIKTLTGFGPASFCDNFKPRDLKPDENEKIPHYVFSPAYILAPIKECNGKHREAEEALGSPKEKSTVMYCTYCLSEDQRWLLATTTDELGEMLETITINIEVPNRTRRKKASARRHGLQRLMEWILMVMSVDVHPWRLVVGRLGRMGHGELKGWLSLLSRKSLSQASKNLREMCKQCAISFPGDSPCILSACVVSLEPDASFRIMPDVFTPDERFGQNSQNCMLSTPQDVSSTHILVFPMSATATAQSAQQRLHEDGDDMFFLDDNMEADNGILNDFPFGEDFMTDNVGQNETFGAQPDSLLTMDGYSNGRISPSCFSGQAKCNGVVTTDHEEDSGNNNLQQQPLALGYYVSTAPTGHLPRWFWSACPHLESVCPVFLRSALHLNQPLVPLGEDYVNSSCKKEHPLDSERLDDVLRYVLEGYNNLSWLVLDPATQDRRSCMPLHMQVLSHLNNVMSALV